jgi:gamma-glutamyltranspeptidase/glutathione hydrolase
MIAGASALRAAAAGYVAVMGEHPGVILGGASILLYGHGAMRAFDGRLRQPGLGAKRPRGWLNSEEIPDPAYCAAPLNFAALFVALAYDEDHRNALVFRSGIACARAAGAMERARLLELIQARGANAWADPQLHRPLLNQAGAAEGGMLSRLDFECGNELDFAATTRSDEGGTWLEEPWAHSAPITDEVVVEGICAVDRRGVAAVISYERCSTGIAINDWQIVAPHRAAPVLRGVTRVRPGIRLPTTTLGRIPFSAQGPMAAELIGDAPLRVLVPSS